MSVPRRVALLAVAAAAVLTGGVAAAVQHEPAEADISVTLTLDRASARVGDAVIATVVVRNGGGRTAVVDEACYSGSSDGLVVQQGLGPVPASPVTGALKTWRDRLAQGLPTTSHVTAATCDPRARIRIAPGRSYERQIPWTATSVNESLFDGAVTLTSRVGIASNADGGYATSAPVALELTGGDSRRMSPMAAVDRALDEPRFARAVAAGGESGRLTFDEATHAYVVTVIRFLGSSSGVEHEAVVDSESGAVLRFTESEFIS